MAFFGSLCCCLKRKPSNTEPPSHHNTDIIHQSWGNNHASHYGVAEFVNENDPYHSSQPLPRYTARPMSIREKTLAFGGRESDVGQQLSLRDEKNQLGFDLNLQSQLYQPPTRSQDDHSSDASSTYSAPSSCGNTSTATAETPPPPYSSYSSRAPSSRSASISLSTHGTGMTQNEAPPLFPLAVTQPPQILHRGPDSNPPTRPSSTDPRQSFESRRSTSSLPPIYSRIR